MASFYCPLIATIHTIPIIVYPLIGCEKAFDRNQKQILEQHLEKLYTTNYDLQTGNYHIVMLWNDGVDRMSDVWIFNNNESEQSGPLIEEKTFRNMNRDTTIGTTAADGLIMLGKETELEEQLRKSGKTLNDYLECERPVLPPDLQAIENFYTI